MRSVQNRIICLWMRKETDMSEMNEAVAVAPVEVKHIPVTLKMVEAGNCTFTVDNGKGKHYTYKVIASKPTPQYPVPTLFVKLLTGSDNTSDYTYMGMLKNHFFKTTKKSAYPESSIPVRVLDWALEVLRGERTLPAGYTILNEGRCCRCGRKLTHPESILTGIGPECAGKVHW